MEKILIQYLRNKNKVPYGVVVATDSNKIGFSLCSSKDRWNKKRGLDIAIARSKKYKDPFAYINEHYKIIPKDLYIEIYAMIDRAHRYYKK